MQPDATTVSTSFRVSSSPGFAQWLASRQISLAFSTYQVGKLFFIGRRDAEHLSIFERTFDRCLGFWSDAQTIWLASAFQLWRLENVLKAGQTTEDHYDRLFVPRWSYTTGDIDVHDVAVDRQGQPLFVNTLFSCLAAPCERYNFRPIWQPPFMTRLSAADACHLNGLACDEGQPRYVTMCAATSERGGWREHRHDGGLLMDVQSGEVVVQGLSMPHAPRIYRGQLWLLNSGTGQFGRVDLARGQLEPVCFCPGYARGLAFVDNYAIIGLSKPREQTFAGLALDEALVQHNRAARCGLMVVDLTSGREVEWLEIEGRIEELYDVLVLPGVQRPKMLGLKTDEIRRHVWFQDGAEVTHWTATE